MDHAEALERIEIAAAEPLGLERLMAGDTPDAAAVAGHLAGCPACVAELAGIRRTAEITREILHSEPDPALRERTLAFVHAVGRDRSAGTGAPATDARPGPVAVVPAGPVTPMRPRLAWVAGLAAALLVAGVLGFAAGGAWPSGQSQGRDPQVALLQDATETAMRIGAQPDATAVDLTAAEAGSRAAGSLLFSAAGGELVMTATDLAPLPSGGEYGCWVELDGERRRLGRMYWAGELWTWAGPATGLEGLPEGTTFGVSLVPAGGGVGEPVLTGEL